MIPNLMFNILLLILTIPNGWINPRPSNSNKLTLPSSTFKLKKSINNVQVSSPN